MKRSARGILVFLFLVLFGCSHVVDYMSIAKKKGGPSEAYLTTLQRWTRSETLYSEFETKIIITATRKSPAFNKAYLDEYARIHDLREGERKANEGIQAELAGDYTEFFFYAATPEKATNDFDRSRSMWTIFLLDGKGNRINPVEVRKIEKITPPIEIYYPYVNQYHGSCYTLKFPPGAGAGTPGGNGDMPPLSLIFTSALGKVELKWER